jgi:WXXGXW repeat (2 copies)
MNRVLLLRVVASLVATSALGGCAYYYSSSSTYSSLAFSDTMPLWDEWPNWGEMWREWRDDYAGREPPPTPIEVIPDSPGGRTVWVGGHWRWENDNFVWVKGRWEKLPRGRSGWVPGRWDHDTHGWYYVRGRWQ